MVKPKFEQVLDKILDAVLLVDKDTKIVYANPSVRFFGYTQSDLVGKSILEFIPEKYKEYSLELIKLFTEGKRDFARIEIEIPEKSGNLKWTDVLISKLDDSTLVVELRDISEIKRLLKEIEESRETYKTIFEAYPDFMSIVDSEGRILSLNRNFLRRFKLDEEKLIGVSILSFVHSSDFDRALNLLKNSVESRSIIRDTLRVVVSGEELIVDISVLFLKLGEKTFGIVVGKDITEKAKLEEEIRKREELYRNIINSNLSGLLLVGEDGRILFANKSATKITGYSENELLGSSGEMFIEPADMENFKKALKYVLEGNKIDAISRFRRKDGSRGYARVLANLMEYEGRKLILVSVEDISEKKKIEKQLEERNALYRTLVENSHTGIFIIQNNKIIYGNNVLFQLFGYTKEEINNLSHPYEIVTPEFRNLAIERYMARERGVDVPESYEVKVRAKDGKEKWLKVLARKIKYKGAPAVMVNLADITKIKENEEFLKRMNDILGVAEEINGILIKEKSESNIISKLKSSLEKLNAEVGIYSFNLESKTLNPIIPLNHLPIEYISGKINLKEIFQEFLDGKWVTFLPIYIDGLSIVVLIERQEKFTEDELKIISTISQNLSIRLKVLSIEREKEKILRIIVDNLNHFEELADKLRNPLAVIRGYLEIQDKVPHNELLSKISEHAERIERILDELRMRELTTYEMKKILEIRAE